MHTLITKHFANTPITIECSSIENTPGTWNSTKVSIYKNDILVGEYIRNYSHYGELTFYPFVQDNIWYALYSASYTSTRVMKLHDDRIEDWCGEETAANGFCPVEIYVPQVAHVDDEVYFADCDYDATEFQKLVKGDDFKELTYCDFGFLCGCVWGDDTSWKIRYVDLTRVAAKILNITDKFGYWPMPANLTLKQCINMNSWEPDHNWICLTKAEHINLTTNEHC